MRIALHVFYPLQVFFDQAACDAWAGPRAQIGAEDKTASGAAAELRQSSDERTERQRRISACIRGTGTCPREEQNAKIYTEYVPN